MGHTRINPFRSPHICGRNLEVAAISKNLLGKLGSFWVPFYMEYPRSSCSYVGFLKFPQFTPTAAVGLET